jgi:nitronate monooxygenase
MNFSLSGNRVNPLFSNTLPPAPHVMSFKPVNNYAMNTSFFDKHGIRLIQAPMAGSQNHRLAAAVLQAGGLGSLPAAMLTAEQLQNELSAFKNSIAAENGKANATASQWASFLPLNVNFFCHTPPPKQLDKETAWRQTLSPLYLAHDIDPQSVGSGPGRAPFSEESLKLIGQFKPAVVSFHFGLPKAQWVQQLKNWGLQIWSSATTVEEAKWLEQQGVDAIIAQGLEAGGHRGMFLTEDISTQVGTMSLLPQLAKAVTLPIIAAGGISSPAAVSAAKTLGASAVQVGTAFLTSHEATTSALHRQALLSASAQHTALTNLFSGRPARGIVNKFMRDFGPLNAQAPSFPLATAAVAPLRAAAEARGLSDFSPLWSGQNASDCEALPAADIAHKLLQGWA